MRASFALIRILFIALVLIVCTLAVLLFALIPVRPRGIPLSAWPITIFGRLFIKVFRIQFTHPDLSKFHQHRGFVFANHLSYTDILLLVSIMPMRFLSTVEVRDALFVGWVARAIGTIFVDRDNQESRDEAREALSHMATYPPVVIFPEGGIYKPSNTLKPFRYGAFEIAINGRIPILPCILRYDPVDLIFWRFTPIVTMLWRLATHPHPLRVELVTLRTIHPQANDNAQQLALETHGAMSAVLHGAGRVQDGL